jgi:hypothetical protein
VVQAIESLLCKYKDLSSIPSPTKKKDSLCVQISLKIGFLYVAWAGLELEILLA